MLITISSTTAAAFSSWASNPGLRVDGNGEWTLAGLIARDAGEYVSASSYPPVIVSGNETTSSSLDPRSNPARRSEDIPPRTAWGVGEEA